VHFLVPFLQTKNYFVEKLKQKFHSATVENKGIKANFTPLKIVQKSMTQSAVYHIEKLDK